MHIGWCLKWSERKTICFSSPHNLFTNWSNGDVIVSKKWRHEFLLRPLSSVQCNWSGSDCNCNYSALGLVMLFYDSYDGVNWCGESLDGMAMKNISGTRFAFALSVMIIFMKIMQLPQILFEVVLRLITMKYLHWREKINQWKT